MPQIKSPGYARGPHPPDGHGSPALVRAFFSHFARPAGRDEQRAVLRALLGNEAGPATGTPVDHAVPTTGIPWRGSGHGNPEKPTGVPATGTPLVLRAGYFAWPQTLLVASLAAEQGYRVEVRSGADQLFP